MDEAFVFNIQKFSVHDGPGIRTTIFFKGCPLACEWCHNPESQSGRKEILYNASLCTFCGQCQASCSNQAIQISKGKMFYDVSRCTGCEACVDHCLQNAREAAGKEVTLSELMTEIEKDRPFYEQSGGGVTLSGGEAMLQIDFIERLIQTCKERGISVAVDTCGYAPSENFMRIVNNVDLFLYDIKLVDAKLHQKYTGQENGLILKNLQLLSDKGANINLRLPLIGGVNADDTHIDKVMQLMKQLHISSVNLLPYHDMGKGKYQKLNKLYNENKFFKPADDWLEETKNQLKQLAVEVQIGG